ncbi:avidin/streptavidin family protein [Ramlibacter albus]|uniref:Avidin n=1 Tax=Ramlibacter albus TaxID=2079448 RepID=A0A923S5M4_9BURK|nr:avidin/streptavidin family protein [Ramlibacter albus]MBC5768725.1 avidin [Ramlibacter albus]
MKHETALQIAVKTENKPGPKSPATWLGKWENQIGSEMTLAVTGTDVTGSYTSASSSGGGPVTGALKGNVSGDLISFLVLWPGGSMTAWTGQLVDDQTAPRIKTLWNLVTDVPDPEEPKRLWTSTFTGADEFTR